MINTCYQPVIDKSALRSGPFSSLFFSAHCFTSRNSINFVRLGDQNLKNDTDDANAIDIFIEKVIKHPSYTGAAKYNDIALVELKKAVK